MELTSFSETPFQIHLCFNQVIEHLENIAADLETERAKSAQALLQEIALFPELRTGLRDISLIQQHSEIIKRLLADFFPVGLTHNEIKAVSIPYTNILINHTERFQKILSSAGPDFGINIRNLDDHQMYVLSCCLVLNECYGTQVNFTKPLFYDIPTAQGITKHYRILYNADFLKILPTKKSVKLSEEEIDLLLNSYDNLALWKEKFPKESYLVKGFAIMTLFDATIENAVSLFKEKLLGLSVAGFRLSVENIFRSIYLIPDIKIGFTLFKPEETKFSTDAFGQQIPSYILPDHEERNDQEVLCSRSYQSLIKEKDYFAISDTAEYLAANPDSPLGHHFLAQNIQSFILAPVVKKQVLLGVLEVLSVRPKELNSINAHKLEVVMPFLTDTLERLMAELQNQVQAIIQDKYTTIHPSVYWKFRAEANKIIHQQQLGVNYELQEIKFPGVYPLFGQIDIKESSVARNLSLQTDLQAQLNALRVVLKKVNAHTRMKQWQEDLIQINSFLHDLSLPLQASTEQLINTYVNRRIHSRLKQITEPDLLPVIEEYFDQTDEEKGSFYTYRRNYNTTISQINEKMVSILDQRQSEAQAIFPHYYERFKTDGVEHNLYLGPSIAPQQEFDLPKLHELRLWQMKVICEMETAHNQLKPLLPYPLEVTTLILVYNSPINIRFRMDEKRFDIDGSYSARFEIVKKRIDKAHIKDTQERITQPGKLTIVYANEADEQEYKNYISVLQALDLLKGEVELLEVEDLQGVFGLKALRVNMVNAEKLEHLS